LAWAFYVHSRHALDRESFSVRDGKLVVEVVDAGRVERHEFNPLCTCVRESERGGCYRLALDVDGVQLEVGRHWDNARRKEFASALRPWLNTLKNELVEMVRK